MTKQAPAPYQVLTLVTPKLAAEMLTKNFNPRVMQPRHVLEFVDKLKAGEYVPAHHQGIGIDAAGRLRDGQHRLQAIVDSGISAQIWLCYNITEAAVTCTDRGSRRTNSVVLGIDARVASAVTLACRTVSSTQRTSESDLLACYVALGDDLNHLVTAAPSCIAKVNTAAIRLAASLMLHHDRGYVTEQFCALSRAKGHQLSKPVSYLLTRMVVSTRKLTVVGQLAQAYHAFDPARIENSKVQINNEGEVLDIIRADIRSRY